jgi:hypothetical protein
VQHLESGAQFLDAGGNATFHHLPGLHAQDGPQALAAGKHAVPHGLMNGGRILRGGREQPLQCLVNDDASLSQSFFEHEEGSITTAPELVRHVVRQKVIAQLNAFREG